MKKVELNEVLKRIEQQRREVVNEIREEERNEKIETIDSINNDIKALNSSTELKKKGFINEIKSGLGEQVKTNPNRIKKIKKKWYQKLGAIIKGIFTKF